MIHLLDDIGLEEAFQNIKTYVDRKTPTMGVFTIGRFSVFNLRECVEQEKNFKGATLRGIIREAINNLILIGYDGSDDEKIPVAISKYGDGYLFNIIVSQAECYEITITQQDILNDVIPWTSIRKYSLSEGGAEGGYDVYFSDLLDEDAIMTIISGGAYLLLDTSKVEEFIANAKGKIVLFNNKNNSSIVIPYIYFFEDSFYFSYCGVNTHNDELGIWHIQYLNGQFTLYNSAVFSDYQKKLVSGTNIKTINNNGILGEGNLVVKAYYPKTFVTIDEFPESVSLIPTEYTIIETVIDGGLTISCKGSQNMNKRADEHLIRFSYSSGSISFGKNIRWQNDTAPTFKSGYTYEISILDNLACFAEFKTA